MKTKRDYTLPHRRAIAALHRNIVQKVKDGEQLYLFLLAVIVGLLMGAVCALFRFLILESHELFFGSTMGTETGTAFRALLPALGALAVGFFVYRVLKLSGGHGVPTVMRAVATGNVNLRSSMAIKSSTSIVTITTGGSAGPEGPIIEIGSVVGSIIGREAQVSKERIGTLVGCGAASGIAGVFNAPIGGVFLALELLMRDFTVRVFGPVVIASVVASVTSEALLPNSPVFARIPPEVIDTVDLTVPQFAMFITLGILTGIFGAMMVYALYWMHDAFQSWNKVPVWLKPAIGGLGVGLVGLLFPGVIGEGYEFVRQDILQEYLEPGIRTIVPSAALFFVLVALVKILVTSLTLGSGGTGGAFAPAMVTGAMVGGGFGVLCQYFFGGAAAAVPVYTLVGMAGAVCSALNIPIAGFLIIYEISGAHYRLILPLMLTVAVSAMVSNLLRQGSVYTLSLLRDGFDVEEVMRKARDPLTRVPVRKIMNKNFTRIAPGDNLKQMIDAFSESEDDAFAVVDADGSLVGMVSTNDLRGVLNLGGVGEAIIAADAADSNPNVLYPESPASEAMAIFGNTNVAGIPVLIKPGSKKIVGLVSRVDVLSAYRGAAVKD